MEMVTPPKQNSACMAETAETPVQSPPCEKKSQLANNYGSCCKMHTTALYAPSVRTQKQNTMAYFSVYGADTHFPSSIPQNQNYTMLKPEPPASASCCTESFGRHLVGYVNTISISLLLGAMVAVVSSLRSRRRPKRMQSSPANNSADASRLKDHN